jgi:hypothetical protein
MYLLPIEKEEIPLSVSVHCKRKCVDAKRRAQDAPLQRPFPDMASHIRRQQVTDWDEEVKNEG